MLFPRRAGSWYHQSKVHDSHNVEMACRLWGLRSTDIMQGVVYGTQIPEMDADPVLRTRFDFDQAFGTAINRFCAQAVIGLPLTPYGKGHQKRGFLPLRDQLCGAARVCRMWRACRRRCTVLVLPHFVTAARLGEVLRGCVQSVLEEERPIQAFSVTATFQTADSAFIRLAPVQESVR